jgi:predicted permease
MIDKTFLSALAIVFMLCGFFFVAVEKETLSLISDMIAMIIVIVLGFELQNDENKNDKL